MFEFFKKHKILIVAIILIIVGFSLYANSFNNALFWDDDDSIVRNTYVHDLKYFPKYFTQNLIAGSGQVSNYWRPLLLTSFAIDYQLYGLNPVGFHVVNTLLHIFSALLAFILLLKLTRKNFWLSFLPSLLFLIHPLQTEAVTYVAGRADPMSTLLSLACLIFYVSFRQKKKIKFIFYSLGFFLLGLLTKEQVIFLPFLVALIELVFFFKKADWKRVFKILFPFFVISIVYFILRITVLDFNNILSGIDYEVGYSANLWVRLLTFSLVMMKYFGLLFAPLNLHMAYDISPVQNFFSWPVLSFSVIVVLIVMICKKFWNKNKLIPFGFLWFFIMLLPRTNIIQINRPMYEHWLYLPMLGFWLAIIALIIHLFKHNKLVIKQIFVIFIIFCIWLAALTINRNKDWDNPITFYEDNLQYTPESFIQRNNLGMAYGNAGRHEEAIDEYQRAIAIKDVYPQVHYNLANSLVGIGHIAEAKKEYLASLKISPTFVIPYQNLIAIYATENNLEAIDKLLVEMSLNVERETFLDIAAVSYFNLGNKQQALEYWQELSKLQPDNLQLRSLVLSLLLELSK